MVLFAMLFTKSEGLVELSLMIYYDQHYLWYDVRWLKSVHESNYEKYSIEQENNLIARKVVSYPIA